MLSFLSLIFYHAMLSQIFSISMLLYCMHEKQSSNINKRKNNFWNLLCALSSARTCVYKLISHSIVMTIYYSHFTKDAEAYKVYLESVLSTWIHQCEAVFYKIK